MNFTFRGISVEQNRCSSNWKSKYLIFYDIYAILLIHSEKHPTFNRHEPTFVSVSGR